MERRGRDRLPLLLLVGIALLAVQLRSPIVALPPVARQAEQGFSVGSAAFGLLTSVPVLCFALATPGAALLGRRLGAEAAITLGLAGIVIATALRSIGPFSLALVSTVVLGAAITIGNVLVPVLIRRDVPARARPAATGLYTVAINIGTMLTTLGTVPLAAAIGWRPATSAWALPGLLTLALWAVLATRSRRAGVPRLESGPRAPLGALGLLLAGTFAAQAFSYYGLTTWLPSLLGEEQHLTAAAAGSASSVFQLAGVAGGLGVPLLATRLRPRTILAIIGVLWISLPAGLLLAPHLFLLTSVTGGAAQGGGFAAVFTIIAGAAADTRAAAALSATVQSAGYLVAAVAPPLVGGLHQLSGGWTVPLLVVLGTTCAFLVLGTSAARVAQRSAA